MSLVAKKMQNPEYTVRLSAPFRSLRSLHFSVKMLNVSMKIFKRPSGFVCFHSFNIVPQVSRIREFLALKQNQLLKLLFYKSQQRCEPAGTKTGLP